MWPFGKLKVGLKLALLIGVPVIGALLLSALIARDAQQRAASAAALGSIEDLAELSARMSVVSRHLQLERARTSYALGAKNADDAELVAARRSTDEGLATLELFLSKRDFEKLPPRLARHLQNARKQMAGLEKIRKESTDPEYNLDEVLGFYAKANESLIAATAALTQLSDDGEMLRGISTLVATMELLERESREHALLSYVFARNEFPPGSFRYFVTLVTEEEAYLASLRNIARDEHYRVVSSALQGPQATKALEMRKKALETSDEEFGIEPSVWFDVQLEKMRGISRLEERARTEVRAAALSKIAETQRTTRTGLGLAAAVLLTSTLLGFAISRGMTRSVKVLASAVAEVQRTGDYSIRAQKTSSDEIGVLNDAFNDMIAAVQGRDAELEAHRHNLEAIVDQRTLALSQRNEQMRLVLDNVEQGLVMLDGDGKFSSECSAAFLRAFGTAQAKAAFEVVLASHDPHFQATLRLAYEQLVADFLPVEVALDQMPKRLEHAGRTYSLNFTPIEHDSKVDGALLVVRDITDELAARHAEAVQREQIKTFERVMRDKYGFLEFFSECRALIERIRDDRFADLAEKLRAIHTLKGNAAIFDVNSVSRAAHELEQALIEENTERAALELQAVSLAWDNFAREIVPLLGEDIGDRIEVTKAELETVIVAARDKQPHAKIEHMLVQLEYEPARARFRRIEEQLKAVAQRLGKAAPVVRITATDVRLPPLRFREFWSSFAHVVRNIVDHGLQSSEERTAAGKPEHNTIELRANSDRSALVIEIGDDGRGIDWEKVRLKAVEKGIPARTQAELEAALFAPGFSTASEVTQQSGRGVGLGAVAEACEKLGGTVRIESELGRGTLFRFTFPSLESDNSLEPPAPRLSMAPVSRRKSSRPAPSLAPMA